MMRQIVENADKGKPLIHKIVGPVKNPFGFTVIYDLSGYLKCDVFMGVILLSFVYIIG